MVLRRYCGFCNLILVCFVLCVPLGFEFCVDLTFGGAVKFG